MKIYCTVFDKNYLIQGLALYESLLIYSRKFKFYILCLDDDVYDILNKLNYPELILLRQSDIMSDEVYLIKSRTTYGQFCWVCQPLICAYVLKNKNELGVTYLEADSIFYSAIETLYEEIGDHSVSIVPHNFSPGFDNSKSAGTYCVQFNFFRNNEIGLAVLEYWKNNCFKYSKNNVYLYPGQTCLDQWPILFPGVKVIKNIGAGVAPWNVQGKSISAQDGKILINGHPVIFYHFHQYGRLPDGSHQLGNYPISNRVLNIIYRDYIIRLRKIDYFLKEKIDINFSFKRIFNTKNNGKICFNFFTLENLVHNIKIIIKFARCRYNIYSDSFFN